MSDLYVVLVTCGSLKEAEKIGQTLVKDRLAACVNVIPKVKSFFFWERKLSEEIESLLIVKTGKNLFPKLALRVKQLHSYQVPEIIGLPIVAGEKKYLDWMKKETRKK